MLFNDFSDEQVFCSFITEEQERNRAIANIIGIKTAVDFFKNCGITCSTKTSLHKIKKIFQETDISDIYIGNLRLDVRLSLDPNEFYIPKKHYELGITPDLYMLVYYDKVSSKTGVVGFITPKEVDKSSSDNYYYYVQKSVIASFEETAKLFDTAPVTESDVPLNIKKKIILYIDNQLSDKNKFYQEIANSKKARELFIEALYADKLLSTTDFKFEYSEEITAPASKSGNEELYDLGFADGLIASELTASIVDADTIEPEEPTEEGDSESIDLEDFIEHSSTEETPNITETIVTDNAPVEQTVEEVEVTEQITEPESKTEPQEEIVPNNTIEFTEESIVETDTINLTEIDLDNFTDEETEQSVEAAEELQMIDAQALETTVKQSEPESLAPVQDILPEIELSETTIEDENDIISEQEEETTLELDTTYSLTEDVPVEIEETENSQFAEPSSDGDLDILPSDANNEEQEDGAQEETEEDEELEFALGIEESSEIPQDVEQDETALGLIEEEEISVEDETFATEEIEEPLDMTPLEDRIDFPEENSQEDIDTLESDIENEPFAIEEEEGFVVAQDNEEIPAPLEYEEDLSLEEEEPVELEEESVENLGLEEVTEIELEEPVLEFTQETEPEILEEPESNSGLSFNEFADDIKVIDENSSTPQNTSQDEDDEDDVDDEEDEDEEDKFDKYDNLDSDYVPDFASGDFSLVGSATEITSQEEEIEIVEPTPAKPLDIQATMEGFVNSMAPEDSLHIANEPARVNIEENSELQSIAENDDSLIEEIAEEVVEEEPAPKEEPPHEPVVETETIEAIDSLYEEEPPVQTTTEVPQYKKVAKKSGGLSSIIVVLSIIAVSAAAWFNKDLIMEKFGGLSQTQAESIPNELATPVEANNSQMVKEQKQKAKPQKQTEAEEILNDVEEPVQLIDTSVSVSQLSVDCDVPSVLVNTSSKRYLIKLAKRTQLQLRNALLLANGQPLANKIVIDLSVSNDVVKFEKISSSSGSKRVDAITTSTMDEILKDTQPYLGTFGKLGGNIRLIVKF